MLVFVLTIAGVAVVAGFSGVPYTFHFLRAGSRGSNINVNCTSQVYACFCTDSSKNSYSSSVFGGYPICFTFEELVAEVAI